jgi:hypothetical protein
VAAVLGLGISGLLIWQATTVTQADPSQAAERFAAAHRTFPSQEPALEIDRSGRIIRRREPVRRGVTESASRMHALVYHARSSNLIEVESPLWFVRLKGGAAQQVFDTAGVDLEALGLTIQDLARSEPGLVLEHEDDKGDRIMIWTR